MRAQPLLPFFFLNKVTSDPSVVVAAALRRVGAGALLRASATLSRAQTAARRPTSPNSPA